MSVEDTERRAVCPSCGRENFLTVQEGIKVSDAVSWPCLACGTPLSHGEEKPPRDRKDFMGSGIMRDTSGGIISLDKLIALAYADIQSTGEDPVEQAVKSTVDALIILGALPEGAVDR